MRVSFDITKSFVSIFCCVQVLKSMVACNAKHTNVVSDFGALWVCVAFKACGVLVVFGCSPTDPSLSLGRSPLLSWSRAPLQGFDWKVVKMERALRIDCEVHESHQNVELNWIVLVSRVPKCLQQSQCNAPMRALASEAKNGPRAAEDKLSTILAGLG